MGSVVWIIVRGGGGGLVHRRGVVMRPESGACRGAGSCADGRSLGCRCGGSPDRPRLPTTARSKRRRRRGRMPDADPAAPAPAVRPSRASRVVRLSVGPGFDANRQAAIVSALTDAGVPSVKVESLPFKIATSRVGYYRAADLQAARQLGRLISPVVAGGSEIGVRDYAQLLADPEPGRLDLWVGD